MPRSALAARLLAGILAAAQPAFADPRAATASDVAHAAATQKSASPAPAGLGSSEPETADGGSRWQERLPSGSAGVREERRGRLRRLLAVWRG